MKKNIPLFIKEIILPSLGYVAIIGFLISLPIIYLFSPFIFSNKPPRPSTSVQIKNSELNGQTSSTSQKEDNQSITQNVIPQISTGSNYSLAIRADGTLWAWGLNFFGRLGDGTTFSKSSPVRIGTESNWKTVSTGNYHSLAVKADGTLWAWGENEHGQLGDGTTIDKISPVRIGTGNNWKTISAGDGYSLAIKTDGTLWAWGYHNSIIPQSYLKPIKITIKSAESTL